MKRLLWPFLIAAAGCGRSAPPVIESFTVDDVNPQYGGGFTLRFVVHDAAIISITPGPGKVTRSPVLVRPYGPTVYTLSAGNAAGWVSRDLQVKAPVVPATNVVRFSVVPAQAPAGTLRTLTWTVRDNATQTLSGEGMDQIPVPASGQMIVAPTSTTTYTLVATSLQGLNPGTARAVARVVSLPAITSFTASSAAILQGEPVTLSWTGTALGWSISANGAVTNLGAAASLVVRPSSTTTYTLTGSGPGGTAGPQTLTITVTPRPGTTLSYTPPGAVGQAFTLLADPCAVPCTALTLRLVAALPASLRGVAIDLPLDPTKVSLNPATFASALDAGAAVLGSGRLQNMLVLGAARKGAGGTPAPDLALAAGAELAHFVLALQSSGGQGIVFDGSSAFESFIQSASGRTPGGIAVGRLEAK